MLDLQPAKTLYARMSRRLLHCFMLTLLGKLVVMKGYIISCIFAQINSQKAKKCLRNFRIILQFLKVRTSWKPGKARPNARRLNSQEKE